jgi:amyloid beta precursor protein binding protein 1
MCRFGAAELHAVAALVGGIASQEVIKVCNSSLSGTVLFFLVLVLFGFAFLI